MRVWKLVSACVVLLGCLTLAGCNPPADSGSGSEAPAGTTVSE